MSERFRNLTILHSNDLHGDFLAEHIDDKLVGGISRLSGYINKVRDEIPHTLYCIAGDMLQGSLIDTEFRGVSTIELMNLLGPDVVTLGNHEIDYGLAHLLFLERCAKFPIVNANLFIKNPYTRLFNGHKIIKINGMVVLFIGIITEEVMSGIKQDQLLSTLVDIEDAANEVGAICNNYRTIDIDLTVLLTHIGFEEDKKLAALLDPQWGVDLIIGGHSHTILEQPVTVNDVLITTAGVGTDQIGHLDLVCDTDLNTIHEYKWKLVEINEENCPKDEALESIIARYKSQTDQKYGRILCRFRHRLTHPDRYQETELGNLFADALRDTLKIDLMLLGSGSIRKTQLGPILTYGDLFECMPYDDKIYLVRVTGEQFKQMVKHFIEATKDGEHGEFYQLSHGFNITYDTASQTFEKFNFNSAPLDDELPISIAIQAFHHKNFEQFLGVKLADTPGGNGMVIATSMDDVLEEYFAIANRPFAEVEGRLIIK